jgi:hypothetical protein
MSFMTLRHRPQGEESFEASGSGNRTQFETLTHLKLRLKDVQ